jgi:hypothetical protein
MLVKILGGIDLIVSLVIFSALFGLDIPSGVWIFFALLLFLKGLFIFTGDIASGMDWIAAIILILNAFFYVPIFLLILAGFLCLQKGFFSVIA